MVSARALAGSTVRYDSFLLVYFVTVPYYLFLIVSAVTVQYELIRMWAR